jgi:hypothetical protein
MSIRARRSSTRNKHHWHWRRLRRLEGSDPQRLSSALAANTFMQPVRGFNGVWQGEAAGEAQRAQGPGKALKPKKSLTALLASAKRKVSSGESKVRRCDPQLITSADDYNEPPAPFTLPRSQRRRTPTNEIAQVDIYTLVYPSFEGSTEASAGVQSICRAVTRDLDAPSRDYFTPLSSFRLAPGVHETTLMTYLPSKILACGVLQGTSAPSSFIQRSRTSHLNGSVRGLACLVVPETMEKT